MGERPTARVRLTAWCGFVWTNGRRFLRWRQVWLSSTLTGAAAFGITMLFVTMSSLSLTPQQVVQRDFGRFKYFAGFGTADISPGSEDAVAFLDHELADLPDRFVALSIDGLIVEGRSTGAREGDWTQNPFPDRYALESGDWPESPGDVVVTRGSDGAAPELGTELTALSGRLALRVVGIATDHFATTSAGYLLASGTYASIPDEVGTSFEALTAQPVVYWSAPRPDSARTVRNALEEYTQISNNIFLGNFHSSFGERRLVAAISPRSWLEDNPAGYAIPSVLLPMLTGLVTALLLARQMAARVRTLVTVGASPRQATAAVTLAVGTAACVAVIVGTGMGYGTSWLLRPMLEEWHDDPLSPIPTAVSPVARALLGAVGALALLPAALRFAGNERSLSARSGGAHQRRFNLTDWRHVLAAAAGAVVVWRLPQTQDPQDVIWFLACAAVLGGLIAPDVVRAFVKILREGSLSSRLARRMIQRDRTRVSGAVGAIAVLIALGVGFTSLLSTLLDAAGESDLPDVLEGQVLVADRATPVAAAPSTTVAWVSRELGHQSLDVKVQLSFLTTGPLGKAESMVVMDGDSGYIIAVEDLSGAEQSLGRRLTPRESDLLTGGGMLDWRESAANMPASHPVKLTVTGDNAGRESATLIASSAERPPADWSRGKDGMMLVASAQDRGFPVTPGAVLFSPVPHEVASELVAAVSVAGIDPGTVQTYEPAEPAVAPLAMKLTALGLFVLIVIVVSLEARARAAALAAYGGTLVAIGLRPRWVQTNFILQQAVVISAAVVTGVAAGVAAIGFSEVFLGARYEVHVPWHDIALLIVAVYGGGVASMAVGLRRLSSTIVPA